MRVRPGSVLPPVIVLTFACGCINVGPKYVPPDVAAPAEFKEATAAVYARLPPGVWRPARPQDAALKGRWWKVFREPELDALEERLDAGNPTIAQYFENFMAARAQVDIARSGYFPTVGINPSVTHTEVGSSSSRAASGSLAGGTSPSGTGTTTSAPTTAGGSGASAGPGYATTTAFVLPALASWAPDLWGKVKNTVQEYRYAAQASAADLVNQRLAEEALLAQYYFELRGQDSLKDLYDRTIVADKQALDYTQVQAETGVGAEEAFVQADVTLKTVEATAVGVASTRAIYAHAIATLTGRPAGALAIPLKPLSTPVPAIPLSVPSAILQRRPDVAAAERACAQANALIGVEMAAYYPSVNLTAGTGFASDSLATLFSLPAFFWSLGASASETIFDGGLRNATVAQYRAMYRADVAAYRQTVLTAFQQVEDYIATLRVASEQISRQELAVKAARRYVDIAMAQFQTGLQPYLDVITAQTTLLLDEQTLVTLRVNEMVAAVQLVQALGGGWDEGQLPNPSEVTSKEAVRKLSGE
jgi:NodT family efflux transporter outer membrane factor (OMF) lipoprotein